MKFFIIKLFISIVATCIANKLLAKEINITNDFSSTNYIGKQAYIYQDTTKSLSFNTIRNNSNIFKLNNTDVINFNLTKNYNWISFDIVNYSKENNLILNLEYPIIDFVKLYVVYDNNIDSVQISENFNKTNRLFNSQFYLFPIKINFKQHAKCYLKLYSSKPILAPIYITNTERIVKDINSIDILSGIYVGIMFAMLLYNLFIYSTTKDSNYIYYVIYIAGVTITQLTILGYSNKYIWPDSSWLSERSVTIVGVISGIVVFAFTDKFLDTKRHLLFFHILFIVLIIVDICALILLLLGYNIISYHIVDANAGIGSLIILLTAIILVYRGYKEAKFFLTGWSIFLLAIILYVIKDYGIVPYNNLTIHSLQVGSALEAILLSFALADKINVYKQEKEASQIEALLASEENRRLISEQNTTLERKVTERTNELVITNNNLNKTLTDLKDAQTQLVEAEKMASLGQLTAGIAHEINNPINFVTSNVGPLKRDVDLLIDAISNIESVGLSEDSAEDKQQQIEDYKEEIDLDYLKLEIGHLINGIHEGATRTADIVKGLKIFSRLDEDDLKKADINEG
ncbi:MAG: histidine kinase, partial [Rickettsiales bacterium]